MFLVREIEEVTEKVTFGQRFKGDESTWEECSKQREQGLQGPEGKERARCGVRQPGWDEGDRDREQRENAGRSCRPYRALEGL